MCSKMMRTMAMGNRPMIVRVLVLILMILVLIMSPLANFAEAHAIAVVDDLAIAGIVVIIGAILVAGGLIVATQDQLRQISQSVWEGIQGMGDDAELLVNELLAINQAVFSAQSQGISAALHVSKRLWDAAFSRFSFTVVDSGDGSIFIGDTVKVSASSKANLSSILNTAGYYQWFVVDHVMYTYTVSLISGNQYKLSILSNGVEVKSQNFYGDLVPLSLVVDGYGRVKLYNRDFASDLYVAYDLPITFPVDVIYPSADGILASGSVALPAPDTLVKVPDLPTQDEKGEIAWPDIPLLPEDARIHDIPDAVGDLTIPDIPYDKVIDAATGAVVGDVVVPDVPDVPTVPDWPTTGDLSIPALIVSKFPFCIPFDVANMIGMLQAEPIEPVFHVPLKYSNVLDYDLVIDFSKFSEIIKIIRWGEQILFVAGLAYATRNYIKW